MKAQIKALCLLTCLSITSLSFAEWNPTPAEESLAGGISIGTGALAAIATPFIFTADVSNNQGLGTASSHSIRHMGHALAMGGTGIVMLVDGTGKGLSELTADSILATGALVETTVGSLNEGIEITRIALRKKDGGVEYKTIPLIVRPDYVQLHEKVGK